MPRGAGAKKRRVGSRVSDLVGQEGVSKALVPDANETTELEPHDGFADALAEIAAEAAAPRMTCICGHMEHVDGSGACMTAACDCPAFEDAAAASAIRRDGPPLLRMRLDEIRLVAAAETLPAPGEPASIPEAVPLLGSTLAWEAILLPEGTLTDDGRAFAPGSVTWRELPLTLMGLVETGPGGHEGAFVAGRIDRIWRDETSNRIRAAGVFDEGEFGREIARMVDAGVLRGNSVDVAVHSYEVGPRSDWFDEDGNWAPKAETEQDDPDEPSLLDILFGEDDDSIFLVTDGVIGASTVCPFPAFAEARIEIAKSLVSGAKPMIWTVTSPGGFAVTARSPKPPVKETHGLTDEQIAEYAAQIKEAGSLAAAGVVTVKIRDDLTAGAGLEIPATPPSEWFSNPSLDAPTPLTITDDGRVFGHVADWTTCHIGLPGCTTAPHSRTENAYFHLGEVVCDDGERFHVGKITMGTGHADSNLGWQAAVAHYDNTGTVVADIVSGEDEHGIWFAGALRPDVDAAKLRELRAATVSGDWRDINGNLEFVALLAVNVPGFPIPRQPRMLVASADGDPHVLSLVAAGIVEHHGLSKIDVETLLTLALEADGVFAEIAEQAE